MDEIQLLVLDKYGHPLEQIEGRTITNWIRRVLHGRKVVCRGCYYREKNKSFTAGSDGAYTIGLGKLD